MRRLRSLFVVALALAVASPAAAEILLLDFESDQLPGEIVGSSAGASFATCTEGDVSPLADRAGAIQLNERSHDQTVRP